MCRKRAYHIRTCGDSCQRSSCTRPKYIDSIIFGFAIGIKSADLSSAQRSGSYPQSGSTDKGCSRYGKCIAIRTSHCRRCQNRIFSRIIKISILIPIGPKTYQLTARYESTREINDSGWIGRHDQIRIIAISCRRRCRIGGTGISNIGHGSRRTETVDIIRRGSRTTRNTIAVSHCILTQRKNRRRRRSSTRRSTCNNTLIILW